ncbi:MAG: NGG1p interacting factor NIF3 [Candidatus Coatesbacteria bacterium]|nr:NGG1p interacting factor NIF3 [Candidatus Coatesbacteria bacterium]
MKLGKLFENLIKSGIEEDPRGKEGIKRILKERKKIYNELSDEDKKFYDIESLSNPYYDSRLQYGDTDSEIRSIMAGIDCEAPELLLADRLREKGKRIDFVLSHHPKRYFGFENELKIQIDLLHDAGIPINIAEGIFIPRIKELERALAPGNDTRSLDTARLLDIPFGSTHTVADNHVHQFLKKKFEKNKPCKVKDVIDLLLEEPEYQDAKKKGNGLKIFAGDRERFAGEIYLYMTGGTSGPKEELEWLAKRSNIGTIVAMHITDERRKLAEQNHINVVIAGHMASDSLGMNLLLDKILRMDKKMEIIPVSGYFWHSRL